MVSMAGSWQLRLRKVTVRKLTARRHQGPRANRTGAQMHFSGLEARREDEVEHDRGEHDQPELAVRPEASQAIVRIVDIERGHLPEELGGGRPHAKQEYNLGARKEPGGGDAEPSNRIESRNPCLGRAAEFER